MLTQAASGVLAGTTQLWSTSSDFSDPTRVSVDPTAALSADGAIGVVGYHQKDGSGKFIAHARVAEFVHPTPTPTPIATNTPTATPKTTPVGALSTIAPVPNSASNDHHVVLRVKDYPTNFRRDYYGYLLRASDHKIVRMGKFTVRNHHGRLEFHDVPPGSYRVFTVVVRTKVPKVISSRQRNIVVK